MIDPHYQLTQPEDPYECPCCHNTHECDCTEQQINDAIREHEEYITAIVDERYREWKEKHDNQKS